MSTNTCVFRALVLKGSVRVAAINEDGASFIDDVTAGDVWFFPAGVPHSLQALHEGAEFLLVFNSGTFSEDETFLATEMILRSPKEVWAKNLQVDVSALDNIPQDQKYVSLNYSGRLKALGASLTNFRR